MAPDSSSASHQPPNCLSRADDWLLRTSELDTHILTQALSSVANPPCSTSSSSNPETLSSSSLDVRNPWPCQTSELEALWVIRALQQQQKQSMSLSGQSSKDCLQRGESSPAFSHASRDQHSDSSFDNSCLSSNSTIAMPNTARTIAMPNTVSGKDQTSTGHCLPAFGNTMAASTENPSPHYNTISSSMALSSQAAVGSGAARVSKRRSRASNKAPIAVLSTDASNFRAMVQQLTGIPSAPDSIYPNYGSQTLGISGVPRVKPHHLKLQYMTECGNLPPTLDTSASLLGYKRTPLHTSPFVQRPGGGVNKGTEGGFTLPANLIVPSLWDSLPASDPERTFPANQVHDLPIMPSRANVYSSSRESPKSSNSLGMEPTKSMFSAVDSWLTFDGALASHPSMEIARMA